MKKILCLIIAAVLMTASATVDAAKKSLPAARLTADSVFIKLPVNVLELLTPSTRMDMLDYYAADSVYVARNLLDGKSRLDTVTPTYLKVILTDVSSLEIKVLPSRKGGDIAAVSYTVDSTGEQADSELFFFDPDMQPIKTDKLLKTPDLKHFFHIDKGSVTTQKELVDMVKFPTIKYSFSPDNTILSAALTVGQYLDVDDFNIMKLFLLPQIQWQWDGSKFKQIK